MTNDVKAWRETVIIPTYGVGKPEKNPMFLEKRVYQGSSGVVYPHAVIEKIEDTKHDQAYEALFIENSYLKIMVLPQLGGRVQMAYDKIRQRHFIYYNQVIKPALVGLTGPWISGGIEFNWPQHHRPSTFEPVDSMIEEHEDGSKTIWVNEIEKMFRTKGMAGFTLYPGKAYLEIKAQLYNRTPLPQTFLWWANPAVKVNDNYQSIFPPDVNAVFDHGKRDVSDFPIATGTYYKVDYAPGTDISLYKNIPVPTSYMAINSAYDFMGGYEHDTEAGVLHVANHHVSPGKKQWTWGHSDFGQAWDRNLTDEDGPYIELMTGMFTDNQPDFSWLMPYEEKQFTQYFLPYTQLGQVKNATKDLLLNYELEGETLLIKVYATGVFKDLSILIKNNDGFVYNGSFSVTPEEPYVNNINIPNPFREENLYIAIVKDGVRLLEYSPAFNEEKPLPEAAKAALSPEETENNEQLFLTGQHLEQYRHATYNPADYYEEALKRDPKDYRCNNALGLWYLRRGKLSESEPYFRTAIATVIQRNPNPYDGEAFFNLGLCLKQQGRNEEAYTAFYKATWNAAWQAASWFILAQLSTIKSDYNTALTHVQNAIDCNAKNGKAWALKAAILRQLQQYEKTIIVCNEAIERDGFNVAAWHELMMAYHASEKQEFAEQASDKVRELLSGNENNVIEYALDYAAAGLYKEAIDWLQMGIKDKETYPMIWYHLAFISHITLNYEQAKYYLLKAALPHKGICFPNKTEDIAVLQFAITNNSKDARAPYYLGCLWYDKRQYDDAIACWELSIARDENFATAYRNLGIASFNKKQDSAQALYYYEKAFALNNQDARVLMELDQLYKRLNTAPAKRLALLEKHAAIVAERDDLYLETITLYNFMGTHEKAYSLLMQRQFHPWEGGEGKVSSQYVYALTEMAKQYLMNDDAPKALLLLQQAQQYPHNLGEGKLYGTKENDILYYIALCYEKLADNEKAKQCLLLATEGSSEPTAAMFYNDQPPEQLFYQAIAWQQLGEKDKAENIFNKLIAYGEQQQHKKPSIDYFAVSLPNMLLFDDDLDLRNKLHCYFMMGLGYLGFNDFSQAKTLFTTVLQKDAMHFGALTHLKMCR